MQVEPHRWVRPLVGLATVLLVALLLWRVGREEPGTGQDAGPARESGADAAGTGHAGSREAPAAAHRSDAASPDAAAVDGSCASLAPFGSLAGIAVDPAGEPIAGLTIAAAVQSDASAAMALERGWLDREAGEPAATTATDADGFFRFARLPAEKTIVVARGAGFVRKAQRGIEVPAGGEAWVELRLQRGLSISGRVADADGAPIAGAMLTAHAALAGASESGASRADGGYEIGGLGSTPCTLVVRADGFLPETRPDVAAGSTGVDFVLRRVAGISGRVVWRGAGTPIPGAVVRALRQQDDEAGDLPFAYSAANSAAGTTGQDGTFELQELAPGRYVVEADAAGRAPGRSGELALEEGRQVAGVVVELGEGASVSGVVRHREGRRPVAGAVVTPASHEGSVPGMELLFDESSMPYLGEAEGADGEDAAVTDAQGRFVLTHVGAGRRTLIARAAGSPGGRVAVEVPEEGERSGVEILLDAGGSIAGTVYGRDGKPAAGVAVTIHSAGEAGGMGFAKSEDDGRYRSDGLRPGRYEVLAMLGPPGEAETAAMLQTATRSGVTVRAGETTEVDIRFAGGTIVHGRVRRAGEAVAGAPLVFLPRGAGGAPAMGTTNDEGAYRVEGVQPGAYMILVGETGVPADIPDVPEVEQDVELPIGTLRGTVVDAESGSPVAGAAVTVVRPGLVADGGLSSWLGGFAGSAISGADGSFAVSGVPDGSFTARASAAGHGPGEATVTVANGTTAAPVVLRLGAGSRLLGVVVDGEGRPVAGAFIDVRDPRGPSIDFESMMTRFSGADGRYVVDGLAPGRYAVRAAARGYAASPAQDVDVTQGGATADFRLTPGGRLDVRVADRLGRPIADAPVTLLDPAGRAADASILPFSFFAPSNRTDDRGELAFEHLAPGAYSVSIADPSGAARGAAVVTEGGATSVALEVPGR